MMNLILPSAGPCFFLAIQGSSIKTALEIQSGKASTNVLSPIPFLSLFVNCVIWSLYGIRKKDMTVLVPNAIGVLSGLYCSSIFHNNSKEKPIHLYALCLITLFICLISSLSTVGYIGCAFAILTCGSPLATLRTVIKNKSTEAMPFLTSAMMFMNALSWWAYGFIVAKDPFIIVPNAVGLSLASIQMFFFILFGLPPNPNKIQTSKQFKDIPL